jgi:hypothetical protein
MEEFLGQIDEEEKTYKSMQPTNRTVQARAKKGAHAACFSWKEAFLAK